MWKHQKQNKCPVLVLMSDNRHILHRKEKSAETGNSKKIFWIYKL